MVTAAGSENPQDWRMAPVDESWPRKGTCRGPFQAGKPGMALVLPSVVFCCGEGEHSACACVCVCVCVCVCMSGMGCGATWSCFTNWNSDFVQAQPGKAARRTPLDFLSSDMSPLLWVFASLCPVPAQTLAWTLSFERNLNGHLCWPKIWTTLYHPKFLNTSSSLFPGSLILP